MAIHEEFNITLSPAMYEVKPVTDADLTYVLNEPEEKGAFDRLLGTVIDQQHISFEEGAGFVGLSEAIDRSALARSLSTCALADACTRKVTFRADSGDVKSSKVTITCDKMSGVSEEEISGQKDTCWRAHQRILSELGPESVRMVDEIDGAREVIAHAENTINSANEKIAQTLGISSSSQT